jgi:hypothetical protein
MPTDLAPSDLVRDIKANTTKWLREEVGVRFAGWQDGSGMFSISSTHLGPLKQYIATQEEHHRRVTFKEELLELFRKNGVDIDPRDRERMGLA